MPRQEAAPFRVAGTCCGIVRGFPMTYCTRNGTVPRGGRLYCRQHDPGDPRENRRQRLEKVLADEARMDAQDAARRRRQLERDACNGLSDADLEQIIRDRSLRVERSGPCGSS